MTHLANRSLNQYYPKATSASGLYIVDEKGRRYLDGSSGAGVTCIGHGNQEVIEAMHEQAQKVSFASSVFYATDIAEQLADDIANHAPKGLNHVNFGCSGSEQVENAMKLARQYQVDIGKPNKRMIIGRKQSYHGMSIATLNVAGHTQRRALYEPMFAGTYLTEPHFEYRYKKPTETTEQYSLQAANALEEKINELGADNVAAFICEPVVGATTGCVDANESYFKRIRSICDDHDILLILDEIFCGMGRTGTLYASEQDNVSADIIVLAKGLAGGYQPISALLMSDQIIDAIANSRGYIANGHTYMNNPIGCAAALTVQQIMRRDKLVERAATMGDYLREKLEVKFSDHPHVGDIRGRGLMQAMEFVKNKETKEPFEQSSDLWLKVMKNAMHRGLMCYPNQGTADGQTGDHVILAPPYIISDAEVDYMVDVLAESIEASL